MSDTKTRKPSVDGFTIAKANNEIAAVGGNIDDLAAEVGMEVASLRPRLSTLRSNGVNLAKLTAKPRGTRKVDYDAINAQLASLGLDTPVVDEAPEVTPEA